MLHAPLGFHPEGAMLAEVDWTMAEEQQGEISLEQKKAMLEAVRRIPGVTAAASVHRVPFTGGLRGIPVFTPGTTDFRLTNSILASYSFTISPSYLRTAGTRLLSGRDFSWHDTTEAPYVAIVNRTFARKMWGEAQAIGQRFVMLDHLREVVGVVEDGKYHDILESPEPVVFLPLSQDVQSYPIFVVRSDRTPNEMAASLERALHVLMPNASISVRPWTDLLTGPLFPARSATVALGIMGLLAAMLAVTGIFGMAAYNVSRGMKELGIRVAIGARKRHVLAAAVAKPILLLIVGSLGGLLCGMFVGRFLGQVVYQANPRDPVVLLGAVLAMALLGVAASAVPALRALAVDPSKLLHED
jgi:hypothetical protein